MNRLIAGTIILLLSGCQSLMPHHQDRGPARPVDVSHIPEPVPVAEPRSRYGNPTYYEVNGQRYYVMQTVEHFVQRGKASWYGVKFHGRRTSSGEPYNMYALTAAHKTLPLPSYVRVTNLDNGKQLVVKVNDRGPFHPGRIIDLSYAAAVRLGFAEQGTANVEIELLTPEKPTPLANSTTNHTVLYVQIGAFRDTRHARKLALAVLEKFGKLAEVSAVQANDTMLYRVRLGPFKDASAAQQWQLELTKIGIQNAKIITEQRAETKTTTTKA
ncbi:MAG: septal ring lytic transglycosylase RlpA family protein [Gammaproteobacteria bacterium]|nr:MAG: septal ring lytic transglycosylase RlpA family protein [Gammaproteobacteria bacterium]